MSLNTILPTSDANSASLDSLLIKAKEEHKKFKVEKDILSKNKPDYPILDENELLTSMHEFQEKFQKEGKKAALTYFQSLGQFCQDYITKTKPYSYLLRAAKFQF